MFIIEHRWCGKLTTGYILTNPQAEIKEKKTQKKHFIFILCVESNEIHTGVQLNTNPGCIQYTPSRSRNDLL